MTSLRTWQAERDELQFGAALVRIVLAFLAMTILPVMYPNIRPGGAVYSAYLFVAIIEQVLIWRRVGGRLRAVVSGIIDMAMITYIVHQVGSTITMMVALYFFASIVNTLVVGRSVGVGLALTGVGMYSSVLVLEVLEVVPFAPDLPASLQLHAPGASEASVAAVSFAALLIGATAIVGRLVQTNLEREAALVDANRQLEELSKKDPLTQLFNRRHVIERVEEELAWLARGRSMAIVMIDLDGFKRINDQRGHVQGDVLLREIAEALRTCCRATDVAGRYGGDEFVVVLPDTSADQAVTAADRVKVAIRDVGVLFDASRPVTASVGIAVARATDTPMSLIERADEQAYGAKKAGGNRVAFAEQAADA